LVPIGASLYQSMFTMQRSALGLTPPETVFVGLRNYTEVLASSQLWAGMGRVLGYAAFQIPIMIGGALALALLIDSLAARYVTFYRLAYFLPYAIPGVIAAVVWTYLYQPDLGPLVSGLEAIGIEFSFLRPDT